MVGKYTTPELYSLAHTLSFTGEQIFIRPGTSEEATPSACCLRFMWEAIQQLIQTCSLLDPAVSHENVLPDAITLCFYGDQSIAFLLEVWCILWWPLRICCYPVFVHDLWLKVKWKKQLFLKPSGLQPKPISLNLFQNSSEQMRGEINKNVHLIMFQQRGILSKEFGRTNKTSYLLLSIKNPAQQSVRTTPSLLKVLWWEVLEALPYPEKM